MSDVDSVDFFTDNAVLHDPYDYLAALRGECPIRREKHHDVMMVTGYDEALAIYNDTERFSSCTSVTGPFPGFPVPLVGDDISELIVAHRDRLPMSDQLPTLDPPVHTDHRALLSRMITPKRLKENEEFMWRLADRQYDIALTEGRCEFNEDYANPFAMLVIADLLGVPEADHEGFRTALLGNTIGASSGESLEHTPWATSTTSSPNTSANDARTPATMYSPVSRRPPSPTEAHRMCSMRYAWRPICSPRDRKRPSVCSAPR